jgi:broad-specificity NMP kinase
MKKVATNTLATLVLIGMISLANVQVSALTDNRGSTDKLQLKRLERIYQHHDRKHELRASVLGINAEELRSQLKAKSLDTIVKKHGFKNRLTFYIAVTGKLKDELRRRGWSERKIEEHIQKRIARLSHTMQKTLTFSV